MWDHQQDLQVATMASRLEEVSSKAPKSGTECKQNKLRSGPVLVCCRPRWGLMVR